MVEEAARGVEGGLAIARPHCRHHRPGLFHRHPRRARDGAGNGTGARRSGRRRLDAGRLRRPAAQRSAARRDRRGDRRAARLRLFPAVRAVRAARSGRRDATPCANACGGSARVRRCFPGDAAALARDRGASRRACLTTSARRPTRRTLSRSRASGSRSTRQPIPPVRSTSSRPTPSRIRPSRSPGRPPEPTMSSDGFRPRQTFPAGHPPAARRQGAGLRPPARRRLRPSLVGGGMAALIATSIDARALLRSTRRAGGCAASSCRASRQTKRRS